VQVREPFKGPSFPEQADPWCSSVLAAIRAQDLGDAAAVPLLAPDIVGVEGVAPAKVGQDLVAGCKTLAFAQRRGDLTFDLLLVYGLWAASLTVSRLSRGLVGS
jgi:hypothetical protein